MTKNKKIVEIPSRFCGLDLVLTDKKPLHQPTPSLAVIKFSVYRFNMSWQAQRQTELRRGAPQKRHSAWGTV